MKLSRNVKVKKRKNRWKKIGIAVKVMIFLLFRSRKSLRMFLVNLSRINWIFARN